VVLENTGNEIRCIFFKLVVPDKRIVVRSEDLAGLLILLRLQTIAQGRDLQLRRSRAAMLRYRDISVAARLEVVLSSLQLART